MRRARLENVARAFEGRAGLYVLGAGASYGLSPTMAQLGPLVEQMFWEGGVFLAGEAPTEDLRSRRVIAGIVGRHGPGLSIKMELAQAMPAGFVQSAALQVTAAALSIDRTPANYGVFGQFPQSRLLNFNLDGLAERWCAGRHFVVSMHGRTPAIYGTVHGRERVEAAQLYNLPSAPAVELMFQPEHLLMHLPIPYSLRPYGFVAVIGYSFSQTATGLDDAVSFRLLCAALGRCSRPIVVIDPAAERIAGMIADATKSQRVFPAPYGWDILSRTLIERRRRGWEAGDMDRAYDMCGNYLAKAG